MPANVYTYWIGPQPAWIGLCLETLRRNCPAAVVLGPEIWDEYDGEIPVATILRQRYNVQSDILRSWLLHRRGGVWIDADAIVWRDLRPIARWLSGADFVAYRAAGRGGICSALIAGRPGSRIAARYWELMQAKCASGRRLPTLAVGPALLRRAIHHVGARHVHWLRPQLVHPLHWTRRAALQRPGHPTVAPRAWSYMLTHRSLGPLLTASRDEILASPTWAGWLFRRALTDRQAGKRCCA